MSSSPLYPNELVIDDDTPEREWHPSVNGFGTGWVKPENAGYAANATGFIDGLSINPSDFQARIEQRESTQTQLSHKMIRAGLPCKNQASTNFCFANAPTHAVEILTVLQNQPLVILSAASVACIVTNFSNRGGWADDALGVIRERGVMPESVWPVNQISRRLDTDTNWKKAEPFKVDKWCTLQPKNMNQLASMLLQDIPVPVAFNWWGHEVTAYDAIWLNGRLAIRCRNSWGMEYGDKGFFVLQGSKMYFDDGIAPLSITAGLAV